MESYSIFNHYKYNDTSTSILDVLSYPVRTCFGGRTIDLITGKKEKPASTVMKIVLFLVAFVIFPIAIVGSICLLLKARSVEIQRLQVEPYAFFEEIKKNKENRIFSMDSALLFLNFCPCKKLDVVTRELLEQQSINLLQKYFPSSSPLIIVSVGPGRAYQELVYLAKLSPLYKHIILRLIEPEDVVALGALEIFCRNHMPDCVITIEKYKTLADTLQSEKQIPDLLLLLDLTDEKYKVGSEELQDHAFQFFKENNLLKANTVITYSVLPSLLSPMGICCSYDGESENLSNIKQDRTEFIVPVLGVI